MSKARRIRELLEPVSKILFLTCATIIWGGFIIVVLATITLFWQLVHCGIGVHHYACGGIWRVLYA